MKVGYLGVNQLGQKYTMYKHPRKELLETLGATKAEKMYVDKKDGSSYDDEVYDALYRLGYWDYLKRQEARA